MACRCNPFPYSAAVYFENKLQPQYFSPANFLCCSALLPNMHKCSNFFAIDKVAVNNFPILLNDILQTPSKKKTISIFFTNWFFSPKSFCRQKLFSLESYWSMIMRRSDNNFSLIAPSREISQLSAETRHLLQK